MAMESFLPSHHPVDPLLPLRRVKEKREGEEKRKEQERKRRQETGRGKALPFYKTHSIIRFTFYFSRTDIKSRMYKYS
jgi:hypothetical protein